MGSGGKSVMEFLIKVRDNSRGAFNSVGAQIRGVKKDTTGLNKGLSTFRSTLGSLPGPAGRLVGALGPLGIAGAAIAATAAIGFFAASAVKAFTAFEDSMANVRKTTGMTKEETNALGESIDGLALRLPVAHGELAKIAAIAGQLGIQGKANILGFTEDIAKMATAFDMSAESAATAMAKMANIYGIPIENVSALGSAINVLGNTTAAQESQIMDFSMALGASAEQLGFCSTEAVAMGATLISMGMDASAAGTRLNSAFTQIAKNTDKVSKFLGKTETAFRAAFGEDPMGMITQITTKLALIEDPLERNAQAAEMFGLIGAKSINALSGDLEGLKVNLANAATGFEENTSLTEEFAAKTDTLKAKFALVGNAAESLKMNIGQALAPMVGVLAEGVSAGISGISKAFSVMQKVAGPVLDLLFIQFHTLKAFLDGLFAPIIQALSHLSGLFEGTGAAVGKLNVVLNVMKDVFTIITGIAKKLGTILGTLLAKAITPLVAKIKEGIKTLTEFYNKLGPIKGLIEGIKDKVGAGAAAIGEWADSFEEAVPPAEELTEAVSELAEEAEKVGPVLIESIKTLGNRLTEASGNYKTAIADISKEINALKDAWNLASDDQKRAIDKQIEALVGVRNELKRGEEEADKYFDTYKKGTKEAIENQKEFKIKIGETTVTFKGMAAEVIKNADAYAKLQKNAEMLLALDWSVFTELEAELPNIDAGIGDMSSAFVGLKDILEDNIIELENVKHSVIGIAETAAPFLEEGFLKGIKSIGDFATALSDAGSAINTFSSLQDVSIEGCINFSLHVNDMVSALHILENQMKDLVPAFGDMDFLIKDIMRSFVSETESLTKGSPLFEFLEKGFETWTKKGAAHAERYYGMLNTLKGVFYDLGLSAESAGAFMFKNFDIFEQMVKESENADEFIQRVTESEMFLGIEVDIVTTNLSKQTTQLSKITNALQPYLEFMRTLNELAALSTLSTDDLNRGLDAISNTLMNLSKAFSTFDLDPAMQALFGSGKEGEGSAEAFTDTMLKHATDFNTLVNYIDRLSTAIMTLTGAFGAFKDINKSVLADETALIELFSSITGIMENFTSAMDKSGFGDKLAAGIEKMVESASPLTTYFVENNAAVTQFNNTLSAFKSVLGGVVDTIDRLLEMTAMTVPEVDDLAAAFDKASEFIEVFNKALMKHIDANKGAWTLNAEFEKHIDKLGEALPVYNRAFDMFDKLASNVMSLSKAFEELKDATIISSIDMDKAMQNIDTFVNRFVDALALNLDNLVDSLIDLDSEWAKHAEEMKDVMPNYETATKDIGTLIGSITSLGGALLSLSEMGVITSAKFDAGFSALITSVANFSESLRNNVVPLIASLQLLRNAWVENEAVLVPLMQDFVIITKNFASLAYNANAMTAAFTELSENSGSLEKGFDALIGFINKVVTSTKEFYTPAAAKAIRQYVIDIGLVIYAFRYLAERIEGATSDIEREIGKAVEDVSAKVLSLKDIIPDMYTYGANTIIAFANGIYNYKWVLEGQLVIIADMIKKYLGVYSPTELGALKDIEKWPKNLVKTFASGINNEMSTLNNSFSGMTLAAPGSGRGNGGNTTYITFKVEQKITDKTTADYSTRELERMINRHEIL